MDADIKTFRVDIENVPAFDSFEDAVHAAVRSARGKAAERDTKALKEHKIVGAEYSNASLVLLLDDKRVLRFSLRDRAVAWEICLQGQDSFESVQKSNHAPPKLLLDFENIPDLYLWERESIARQIVGATIILLAGSNAMVFLYTDICPRINLSRMLLDNQESLFFCFD